MQTFLPAQSYEQSARCLDNKRLGKQRVEAYQILLTLRKGAKAKGWRNHPAVRMWDGYEKSLKLYINACINEWKRRGFRNNMKTYRVTGKVESPYWLGNENFHASHRSNLLRKNFEYYSRFKWTENPSLPYIWPKSMALKSQSKENTSRSLKRK